MSNRPIITGIMACDLMGAIGKNNKLPWNSEEELEHFRKTTIDNVMIMGYQTFTSMPERALENRQNIVFSRTARIQIKENIVFVSSLQEFLSLINDYKDQKCFMIGGAQIVNLFLANNLITEFILTKFKRTYGGDVFFPLHLLENWSYIIISEHTDFIIYKYLNPG
ncbi:Dihydrofolate reductase [Candidatus Trichorickettsia mobilis]|uniref:dihydrofolate reductase n=1 Tax=Candidatus Trichorickettsia mobilis TaxID=1346319 RepID=A0ABZ0UQR2_9RICK|nr:dihydrofolate reductase [Candidatus Trichorickettsia mobilis]WPY00156.1 Dihydrofolate reductase [Candidatus Trichorickettsia mobilis]